MFFFEKKNQKTFAPCSVGFTLHKAASVARAVHPIVTYSYLGAKRLQNVPASLGSRRRTPLRRHSHHTPHCFFQLTRRVLSAPMGPQSTLTCLAALPQPVASSRLVTRFAMRLPYPGAVMRRAKANG
jgi:hypothetical protein